MSSHVVIEGGRIVAEYGGTNWVPWWSVTKTVLAGASLVLVDGGRLRLDGNLPGRPFSLRQLLQHCAGLGDYGGVADYHKAVEHGQDAWSSAEMLVRSDGHRPRYEPGAGWCYSNIGYFLVRQIIEEVSGYPIRQALERLVLHPLSIAAVRFADTKDDLTGVQMGDAAGYDPRWVYHGLLVGQLGEACLLLHRLMQGDLLHPHLLAEMQQRHPLVEPIEGRPWHSPGYGLGLMIGTLSTGAAVAGHTGGGPGSTIAVYHFIGSQPPRTVAAFSLGNEQGDVERFCEQLASLKQE